MKTLKRIDFKFNLTYQVKEITKIKINYQGTINLSFSSRKKDLLFSCIAYGSEIVPCLYSTNDVLDRDEYNYIQDLLNNKILITFIEAFIQENNFPPSLSGHILIKDDDYNFLIDNIEEKGI